METFEKHVPEEFASPEQIPDSPDVAQKWQAANRNFWESNPMRYDWKTGVGHAEHSREFYREIDDRFFSNVREFMPWKSIPFDNLVDFASLSNKRVLEIGVGNGSHAQLLASHAGAYVGIDLTSYAAKSTATRLSLFNIPGEVMQMDAEAMTFADASFDLVWSWGVIHHSSNTRKILDGMRRVLKPGGEAILMVYHRGWWNYYVCGALIHGIIRGDLFRSRSLTKTVQRQTDGAFARYYTVDSFGKLMKDAGFKVEYVVVKGSKAEVFPIPGGRLKTRLMSWVPNAFTRFLTNQLRMGMFVVCKVSKP